MAPVTICWEGWDPANPTGGGIPGVAFWTMTVYQPISDGGSIITSYVHKHNRDGSDIAGDPWRSAGHRDPVASPVIMSQWTIDFFETADPNFQQQSMAFRITNYAGDSDTSTVYVTNADVINSEPGGSGCRTGD